MIMTRRRALLERFVVSQRTAQTDPWAERVAGRLGSRLVARWNRVAPPTPRSDVISPPRPRSRSA